MANQGWAFTGQAAEDALASEVQAQEMRREEASKTRRFWIKEIGASRSITFVDGQKHPKGYDLPFAFMEHGIQMFVGGKKRWNQFTCLGKGCPMCAQGDRPYLARVYTVIDHTEYTSQDGKVHKDELRLFVAKTTVQKILNKYIEKKKSLRGWKVDVSRLSPQSASTGDQFIFDEHTDLDNSIQPVDYFEMLAPKSPEDIKKVLSGLSGSSVGYNDVVDTSTSEEDAPIRF